MSDLPEYLSRDETADYLRCSLPTVNRLINRGDLESVKVGGLRRVLVSSIRNLMKVKKSNKKG